MKKQPALQGTWSIVSLEVGGKKVPAGAARIVLEGDRFTTSGMGAEYEGTFALDEKKMPKTFDMTFLSGPEKGNKNLGIFELDSDTWRLCLDMTGKSRPKEFVSGQGVALETLKRVASAETKTSKNVPRLPIMAAPELEGEWTMVSCIMNGDALPSSMVKYGKRVARGNEVTVSMAGKTVLKAQFTVDREKKPATIDYLLPDGQLQHGIYDLEGGNLKVIFSAPRAPRPAHFSTFAGDGRTLTVWKLVKQ
jgi:uncharacterized protein (TIGR03067 family)